MELFVRETHEKAIQFYESIDFFKEGVQKHKILNSEGEFETPLHMAWLRP